MGGSPRRRLNVVEVDGFVSPPYPYVERRWLKSTTRIGRLNDRVSVKIRAHNDRQFGSTRDGREQDQAYRRKRRRLHRRTGQRAAACRLPRVDRSSQEGDAATTQDVGTQHRRLRLLPVHV